MDPRRPLKYEQTLDPRGEQHTYKFIRKFFLEPINPNKSPEMHWTPLNSFGPDESPLNLDEPKWTLMNLGDGPFWTLSLLMDHFETELNPNEAP